jgi:hypothetical protein
MDLKRPAKGFRDACAAGVLVGRDFRRSSSTCRISIGTMDEMQKAVAVPCGACRAPATSRQGGR